MSARKKVAVALSGGVDSSVTAFLLKEQGYEVVCVTGLMYGNFAFEKAKEVADFLGLKHYIVDLKKEFSDIVISYFLDTYRQGETPNPCCICNPRIKWGKLLDYALNELGCDFFATGHYANIERQGDKFFLKRAKCDEKDQLYFLYMLSQEQLSKTIFPLGNYSSKSQIREIALSNNIPSGQSKDSQGVCFIEKPISVRKYLINNLNPERGKVLRINTNECLGKHDGCCHYTVGQRKGLGIADKYPLYVHSIDAKNNIVYVGYKDDCFNNSLILGVINWQQEEYNDKEFRAVAKIRYNSPAVSCRIIPYENNKVKVVFDNDVFAIAKGQICVIYDETNSFLISGGIIEESI